MRLHDLCQAAFSPTARSSRLTFRAGPPSKVLAQECSNSISSSLGYRLIVHENLILGFTTLFHETRVNGFRAREWS